MPRLTVPPNIIGTFSSDKIQAKTTAFNDIGIQVNSDGVIATREANDIVSSTATGESSYGINDDGFISLGSGNDSLSGKSTFTGIQVALSSQPGVLDGGSGDDIIKGIANSTGFTHNAVGIATNSFLNGGNGNDIISGEGRGVVSGNVSSGLAGRGVINGGNGNDTLTGIGIDKNGFGYGISTIDDGYVRGGSGDDVITGYGTTTGYGNPIAIETGEGKTIINGDDGNDYLKARRINKDSTDALDQGGAVENVSILGGKGNDTFDVGYGNANLDGGQGFDTLQLLGSSDDYSIQSSNEQLTIIREEYTMNVLNIENIVFTSDPLA
jgi:Ca2+-binding RTX toxin-like protein